MGLFYARAMGFRPPIRPITLGGPHNLPLPGVVRVLLLRIIYVLNHKFEGSDPQASTVWTKCSQLG